MSITRTLDGKLSATLAMISIVGWLAVAIVDMYRAGIFPDVATVALVLGLAVTAYKFYSEDKQASKDPETQKAQLEAANEIFLDKLAKYTAEHRPELEGSDVVNAILNFMTSKPTDSGASTEEEEFGFD